MAPLHAAALLLSALLLFWVQLFFARLLLPPFGGTPAVWTGCLVFYQGVLLAGYGFRLQIYGDFAGYSDIAIGCGRLLGFELPGNFRSPYKATSFTDYWRRWHITHFLSVPTTLARWYSS